MQFVALDLETTGLNPKKDTIIEIAAIKFSLTKKSGKFCVENFEEKTMLIDPKIPLEPEVTLVTGITPQMLHGKKIWSEVREKVADFIGDAVVVGHNILFDKEVLENHDINLENNIFLDTFELAGMISLDAKSLNLGFLAEFYDIKKRGEEHRALTDTWLSVDLFCHFLTEIATWDEKKKSILATFVAKSKDKNLETIAKITEINLEKYKTYNLPKNLLTENIEKIEEEKNENIENIYQILAPTKEATWDFFEKVQKKYKKISIITRNENESKNLESLLKEKNISASRLPSKNIFLSTSALDEAIKSDEMFERKKAILLLRLIFWYEAKGASLENFKSYGIERKILPFFKMRDGEICEEYEEILEKSKENSFQILSAFTFAKSKSALGEAIIYKDAGLLEGILRQAFSKKVFFHFLYEALDTLEQTDVTIHLKEILSVIEDIYFQVANRPTGDNPFPPGNFGETYVIPQEVLWKKMGRSLALWGNSLQENLEDFEANFTPKNRHETYLKKDIITSLQSIQSFHQFRDKSIFLILTIKENFTSVQYISNTLKGFLPKKTSVCLEYTSENQASKDFITRNFGENICEISEKVDQKIQSENHKKIRANKTVILTTSLRHIQEIGAEIEDFFDGKIIMQGVSGGKEKMLQNYKNAEKCVLVGLIETWRDSEELWKNTEETFIAKVPFDPPSDPYFLVKAKSLVNNFDEYSIPMCINRINTLIGNIVCQNPEIKIYCSDKRLRQSKWGKKVSEALL